MINDHSPLFFAGEALANGVSATTVEGALASGRDIARKILEAAESTRKKAIR